MSDAGGVLATIDASIPGRALIFGSLPPDNRDLDLLVRRAEESAITAVLNQEGFERLRSQWTRFRDCSVDVVDVVPAAAWGIDEPEGRLLFEEALTVEGMQNVVRPAPHHMLLILARRFVRGNGTLDDKRRQRITRAVQENPAAWEEARLRASGWRGTSALALLQNVYRTGVFAPKIQRLRAQIEILPPGSSAGARLSACRSVVARGAPGSVIAFSGLDGSGKTSQATALKETLDRLGIDACLEWTRLAHGSSLDFVAKPVKALFRRSRPASVDWLPGGVRELGRTQDPAKLLRRRSALLTQAWATIVALDNGWSQFRVTRRHIRAGRFVICDRYTLDSAVHLRYRYGEERRFLFQVALIRLLSPKPLRAYFVDVPADVALYRKGEEYVAEQLQLQEIIYKQEHTRFGARRLDGELARDQLCAEIARDVWRASGEKRSALRDLLVRSSKIASLNMADAVGPQLFVASTVRQDTV